MEIKRLLIFIFATFLILGLFACQRPASKAPTGEATETLAESFPLPGTSDDVMGQLESFATQTAIALLGGTPATELPTGVSTGEAATTPVATGEVTAEAVQPTSPPQAVEPSSTPIPVPSATPGRPSSYTLKGGEFPYCIARRFNVNPNEMLRLSGLSTSGSYPSGTVLKIPQDGKFPGNRSLKSHPTNYTVGSGESIFSIACKFGDADPNAIATANGLSAPYRLSAGQTIYIP